MLLGAQGNIHIERSSGPRLAELDFLRGIAILMVIGYHGAMPASAAGRLEPFISAWQSWGWTGVDLFFVLSGFLVGGLLFREIRLHGRLEVRRFIIRRGLKIWPMYYAFLCIGFPIVMLRSHHSIGYTSHLFLPYLLHLQNYDMNMHALHQSDLEAMGIMSQAWSLAVEEHFYIILPLIIVLLLRTASGVSRLKWLPGITVGVALFCLTARIANLGHLNERQLFPTHLRVDSLFCGVLLAYLYHCKGDVWQRLTRRPLALLAVGSGVLLAVYSLQYSHKFIWTFGYSLIAIGYACVLCSVVEMGKKPGLYSAFFCSHPVRLVARIGYYSYGLYLWHRLGRFVGVWIYSRGVFGSHSELRWLLVFTAYLATSWLLALLMCRIVEFPCLAWRDRLYPSRALSV